MSKFATWIITTTAGFCVGFLAYVQLFNLIAYGKMTWQTGMEHSLSTYIALLVGLLAAGAIVGSAQVLVTRSFSVQVVPWILSTAAGFGALIAIIWPLHYVELWGNIPGPAEPIIVLVGGGSLAGVFQFMVLRRHGINAAKWLLIWIAGLIFSLVPTALVFMLLEGPLGVSYSWPVGVALSGLLIGGFAALVSAKAVIVALSGQSGDVERSE